jgi:murein DD-endopeptidase MepM/ murein hydrolase activator NlpD
MAESKRIPLQGSRMNLGFLGTAAALPILIFSAGLWMQTDSAAFLSGANIRETLAARATVHPFPQEASADILPAPTAVQMPVPNPPAPTVKRQSETLLAFAPRFVGFDPASLAEVREPVAAGDTMIHFLQRLGVERMDAFNAVSALAQVWNPRDLRAGLEVAVVTGMPSDADAQARFAGLYFRPDVERDILLTPSENGFKAETIARELTREVAYGGSTIDSSLFHSGSRAGVPVSVLLDMIKAFSYNVDFQRDLKKGDAFEVLYDVYRDDTGARARSGNLGYAALTLGGKKREIYAFETSAGVRDFFDRTGQSIRRALLRTPVDGARISSGYGFRRHPILGFNKMHRGVDFAAPTGTPVRASGDGVIEQIGPFGAYGNYLRIRHDGTYSTAYAHLNGFRRGLQRGSRVKQGDVIAYIGTTGRSTGPHLHYEVMKAGVQVNPASLNIATGNSLAGRELAEFRKLVTKYDLQAASLRPARAPLVAENSQPRQSARN